MASQNSPPVARWNSPPGRIEVMAWASSPCAHAVGVAVGDHQWNAGACRLTVAGGGRVPTGRVGVVGAGRVARRGDA